MGVLSHSTYLDFTSGGSSLVTTPGGSGVGSAFVLNVALVMERANDPTSLLESSWATRQKSLQALGDAVWSVYGANPTNYGAVQAYLQDNGYAIQNPTGLVNQQYVTSPESRTIWVSLNAAQFAALLGQTLMSGPNANPQYASQTTTLYWEGSLSLPDQLIALGVKGLWFDSSDFIGVVPASATWLQASLPQGAQSIGNSAPSQSVQLLPNIIAQAYYNFPLADDLWNPSSATAVNTGAIGVVEAGIGNAVPAGPSFNALLDQYRQSVGISTPASVTAYGSPSAYPSAGDLASERSLDVGILTATNPQSPLILYAGSGNSTDAFAAYQSAIWDTANNPSVVSSSFKFTSSQMVKDSPFLFAAREMLRDAALRNVTLLSSSGDTGSGYEFADGGVHVSIPRMSPYSLIVGGTSMSGYAAASVDPSLAAIWTVLLAAGQSSSNLTMSDLKTIWQLVGAGLNSLPTPSSGVNSPFVETAWNSYYLAGTVFTQGYLNNHTSTGGVDVTQAVPSYQEKFGLQPAEAGTMLTGRGVPDVSALAGGNLFYVVPTGDMVGQTASSGTSAATPLWAALVSQFNAIFADHGLGPLGYMNDLLYQAAAIAPASFNDVTMGNNVSSFGLGGAFTTDIRETGGGSPQTQQITPTGVGYYAGPGYDLVTGLGSPNGLLLARSLVDIAHKQMYFESVPHVLDGDAAAGWRSGTDQTVSFQTASGFDMAFSLGTGQATMGFFSGPSASFAWTSQFAQQVLQPTFDPALVLLFDMQSQGFATQSHLAMNERLSVSINGTAAQAVQGSLTTEFGFADFMTSQGVVRVAQPVMVAETAGGLDDQTAIVRIRQSGTDNLAISFFRVDDYQGSIGRLHPGDVGYAAAAEARAYQLATGGTSISGPGYGNYEQTALLGVDAGDLVAQRLTDQTTSATYWSFAGGNESVGGQHIVHQWNYGHNVVGWEDMFGGGDFDFNDLVVGIDFTSAGGQHGWLI